MTRQNASLPILCEAPIVGVDGGGSKTRAVCVRRGRVERSALGPASNPWTVGLELAIERVLQIVSEVLHGQEPAAIGVGLAGLGVARDAADALRAALAERFDGAALFAASDVSAALAGAFVAHSGVLVVGGTGSVAIGYRSNGADGNEPARASELVQVGGWGRRVGDSGSGFEVFRQAAFAILRREDGVDREGDVRALRDALLRALELDDPRELVPIFARDPSAAELRSAVASIVATAKAGDVFSRALLEAQGRDLAALAVAAARRTGDACDVAAIGGFLLGSDVVGTSFDAALQLHGLQRTSAQLEPEHGVACLAASQRADASSCDEDPSAVERFRKLRSAIEARADRRLR